MKTALPLQTFGLGDVIWSQTLIHKFISDGYKIIWPVKNHFVAGLNRAYPQITFLPDTLFKADLFNTKQDTIIDGVRILPIRWADSLMKVPYESCMKAKYSLYSMDWRDWQKEAMWERDAARERSLLRRLAINEGDKFNLINRRFKTDASGMVNIRVNNGLRNVEMEDIEGYSLFDWAAVIEAATTIHVVSSAIIYILEMLDFITRDIYIYIRVGQEKDHRNYSYILRTHSYTLVD